MNVHEFTQSFQTLVDSITTSGPAEHYVTKDLLQTYMVSVLNTMIQLVQNMNQLTWGFHTGIGKLSNSLESLEESNKLVCKNTTEMSDKIQTLENNNSYMHDNIQKLAYKLNNIDLDSAHMHKNITELSHKKCQLQEHNTQLNNSLSLISGNVKELQKDTSTIMSNIQNQQEYIDNLADSVENLKEKTSSVFNSTPKPPPGFLRSQIVPVIPFFASNSIPGFVIPVISQSHRLDISADMILQTQHSEKCLGEILSVPSVQQKLLQYHKMCVSRKSHRCIMTQMEAQGIPCTSP